MVGGHSRWSCGRGRPGGGDGFRVGRGGDGSRCAPPPSGLGRPFTPPSGGKGCCAQGWGDSLRCAPFLCEAPVALALASRFARFRDRAWEGAAPNGHPARRRRTSLRAAGAAHRQAAGAPKERGLPERDPPCGVFRGPHSTGHRPELARQEGIARTMPEWSGLNRVSLCIREEIV